MGIRVTGIRGALAVTLGIRNPDLNDLGVVGRDRAFGDREAAVTRLHLNAVIGNAQADRKVERL